MSTLAVLKGDRSLERQVSLTSTARVERQLAFALARSVAA
jgi:D-alanine-D-alanine ligase-like ATP-grasp enzyme